MDLEFILIIIHVALGIDFREMVQWTFILTNASRQSTCSSTPCYFLGIGTRQEFYVTTSLSLNQV